MKIELIREIANRQKIKREDLKEKNCLPTPEMQRVGQLNYWIPELRLKEI